MSLAVKTPEVAGHEPTVDDSFRREFGLIQVAGHDGLTSNGNFANAVGGRIHDAHFHPRQWLANRVSAEWFQIVDRDGRAGFRESVAIGDGNPEIVEKLQRLRFGERAANDDRAKLSAKRFMDLLEQAAANAEARLALRQPLVDSNKYVENLSLARRQRVEARLQAFLQVFQNERNETHVGDLIFRKRFAHKFRTQRAQMHDGCTASERPEKADHKIDGMVGRQNTEVAHARPERINRY